MAEIIHFEDSLTKNNKSDLNYCFNSIPKLVNYLTILPLDMTIRAKLEVHYKTIANNILSKQEDNGLWKLNSINNNQTQKSTFYSTSLFIYYLAWGINNDLLDKSYSSTIKKAWLTNYNLRVKSENSIDNDILDFNSVGAFLLAGKELIMLN